MNQQPSNFSASVLAGIRKNLPEIRQQLADAREGIAILTEAGHDATALTAQVRQLEQQVSRWEAVLTSRGA